MSSLNPTGSPPEGKVVASGTYGSITLIVIWILTNYVFHGHIPPDLQNLLPGFVSMVVAMAAGWWAQHTPRMDETVAAVRRELSAQQRELATQRRPAQPGGVIVPQSVPPAPGPTGMAR